MSNDRNISKVKVKAITAASTLPVFGPLVLLVIVLLLGAQRGM